jgi:hypothetical protein
MNIPIQIASSSQIVAKPDGTKFGKFYLFYKYFRLFDSDGKVVKEVKVNIEPYTDYSFNGDINKFAYYARVAASNDRIYAFCSNYNADHIDEITSELQIWDWDGNPIARYEFDKPPYFCCISLNDMKIYAFNNMRIEDNGVLRVYDLLGL